MRILVTNDDGVHAPGLRALAAELRRLGDVAIAAPSVQKSAISSSITLYTPLIAHHRREEGMDVYAVDGTPADAVKLAICELLPERPELLVSGINWGLNTGSNILYSGTVAGALEGALYSIPSFAVSLQVSGEARWSAAARVGRRIIERILPRYPEEGMVLNVNLPARPSARIRGTLVTEQDGVPHADSYERRQDPRGRTYYWLKGTPVRPPLSQNGAPTDDWAVTNGYISVTPLCRDLTHHGALDLMRRLLHKKL